jgi:aromatic ring-cleaving dioxygenase
MRTSILTPQRLGRWHPTPIGPHAAAMYQAAFGVEAFAGLVPWLALHREGLSILMHPNTLAPRADHLVHVLWLGPPLPLRPEVLPERTEAAEESPVRWHRRGPGRGRPGQWLGRPPLDDRGGRGRGGEGRQEQVRPADPAPLRRDSAAAAWQTAKEVHSDTELTTAQWIASDSKALRGVLDRCIRRAAHQLASDLDRAAPGQGAPVPSK